MTLRLRLAFAFLVLAVVPLAVLVLYTYTSSINAYRGAVEAATRARAEELNERMAVAKAELDRSLSLTATEVAALADDEGTVDRAELERRVREGFVPIAPLVESFEFVPRSFAVAEGWSPPEGDAEESAAPVGPPAQEPVVMLIGPEPEAPAPPVAVTDEELIDAQIQGLDAGLRALEESSRAALEGLQELGAIDEETADAASAEGERVARVLRGALPLAVRMTRQRLDELRERRREAEAVLGERFHYPVRRDREVVGHLVAEVRPEQVLEAVLGGGRREPGELAFARDREGKLYTASRSDRKTLASLGLDDPAAGQQAATRADWIVVETRDDASGLSFGIARPIDEGLAEIRRTAVRNLGWGLALVAVAMLGILPLSRRMTHGLTDLTGAAGRLAEGDLSARVPVRSRDEIGRLAHAFNRMAEDLEQNQARLLEQERIRREQEVERRVLETENARRGRELEEARRFQLSLLPGELPQLEDLDLAVSMRTATEVGGDYYDFRRGSDDRLTLAVGDATGHGVAAGTMVTVAKSLFTTAGEVRPSTFLAEASGVIRGMRLGRVSMALLVAAYRDGRLVLSAAGMPPALVHRAGEGRVEEVLVPGMPLGSFSDPTYEDVEVELAPGDTVLLVSDGFPELPDPSGEPLGYERARAAFAATAHGRPAEIISALERVADRWRREGPIADDMTFVVLRRRRPGTPGA